VKKTYWRFYRLEGKSFGDRKRPPACVPANEYPAYIVKRRGVGEWDLDAIEVSVDAALKKTERGSQYGILALGVKENRRFLLDDVTERYDFLQALDAIRGLIRLWRPQRLLIEDKAAGPQIISTLKEEIAGGKIIGFDGEAMICAIEALEPDGDKTARMEAVLPTISANLVYLPEGADFVDPFVEELGNFPNGMTDRGDALSQFLSQHRISDYAAIIARGGLRMF
jgi:predicted phage terminase large subunit-like protein